MAPQYQVHNLQIVTVLQSHSTILPQSTFCRLSQCYSLHYSFHQPTNHQAPQSPKHHQPRPTKDQEPPHTKSHKRNTLTQKQPKHIKPQEKIENRKDKNPLCYICWVHIAQWLEQWLEQWSYKPLVMGSIPSCCCVDMGTLSIPQSDNPQSATRIKDCFRRSQSRKNSIFMVALKMLADGLPQLCSNRLLLYLLGPLW